jgi:hypothetical protein
MSKPAVETSVESLFPGMLPEEVPSTPVAEEDADDRKQLRNERGRPDGDPEHDWQEAECAVIGNAR